MNLRKLSVIAITALLVTGISGVSAVAGIARPATTTTSLTTLITTLINSVGDDVFSTIDLTTLANSFPSSAPTPLHSFSLTARTQLDSTSSGTSTTHYGPFTGSSPDSGTCGNDWASDTFDRHFTVFQNSDGSLLVVEQFKNGAFVTPAPAGDPARTPNGPSPGGCQNSATTQGKVNDGVTGSLHGYFVIPLPGETQTSFDPHCNGTSMTNAGCDTTTFINTHFSPACYPSTCSVTTFFFHYTAGGQGLIINEWKNASADRGGNNGDIRSTNV